MGSVSLGNDIIETYQVGYRKDILLNYILDNIQVPAFLLEKT